MKRADKYERVVDYFESIMPEPTTELNYRTSFELVVAVVLSAQCTDKRVNMITPALFEAYPTPEMMSRADVDDLFEYIKSVSYPNNKAKHLKNLSIVLTNQFGGVVPDTFDDMVLLPGVGRKTANVVLSQLYHQSKVGVDTHVYRVSRRLGLVPMSANTPLKVEQILEKNFPQEVLHKVNHWLVLFGRYTCIARNPKCLECSFSDFCRYYHSKL